MNHIKQIYVVYNKPGYMVLLNDQVQGIANLPGGIGEVQSELELMELNTYYENFRVQAASEGKYLNFTKGVYVRNGQPNDCILIESQPIPPPIPVFTARDITIFNNRTVGDPVVILFLDSMIGNNITAIGGNFVTTVWLPDFSGPIYVLNEVTVDSYPTGIYKVISSNVRVTFKKNGILLESLVQTAGVPFAPPPYVNAEFNEIYLEDAAAPPPPLKSGNFEVLGVGANTDINNVRLLTNAGIAYPVTNALDNTGTWSNFAGGFNSVIVDVTSTKLLELNLFINGAAVAGLWNMPGTGSYTFANCPNPANGDVIRVRVRELN